MIHFGLGSAQGIDSLVISWYDKGKSVLYKIKTGQTLILDKEKLKIEKVNLLKTKGSLLFNDVTKKNGITFGHKQNIFNDFEREGLTSS